jgi:hypothetical protein
LEEGLRHFVYLNFLGLRDDEPCDDCDSCDDVYLQRTLVEVVVVDDDEDGLVTDAGGALDDLGACFFGGAIVVDILRSVGFLLT